MSTYTQLPGSLGLSLRRGDELSTSIDFNPVTLTGYTVTASINSLITGGVMQPITATITNAAAGVVNLSMTEAQTAVLPVGTYSWRLEWDNGAKRTALGGMVEVVG